MSDTVKPRISADLSDRVALVTGAGRGLGRAIAASLAAAGARVACVDIHPDLLAETVGAINKNGGTAAPFPCDVTDSEGVTATVGTVVSQFGGLDILVNNAGITRDTLFLRMSEE
ncbi:MAG: SDR family NAD(P)-dependent oxidoreductase, partial [Pirellulales bacterium]